MAGNGEHGQASYIYGLKDPRDGLIYYVGKSNHPERRKREHLEDATTNAARVGWLNDLKAACLEPELVILERVDRNDWQRAEVYWIAKGYEDGWPLVNIAKGGGGDGRPPQPDYEFMRSYVHPGLWDKFAGLMIRDKDRVCLVTAQAMVNSYAVFLDRKIEQRQFAMHRLVDDELVQIGMRVATETVAALGTG